MTMSEWRYFVNKTAQHNKFWQFRYTQDGKAVEKQWGRIGGRTDTQTKIFGSGYAAQRYADSEVNKKLRKGYEESDMENLQEETQVAKTIGVRWKVNRMEFLDGEWGADKNLTVERADIYNPHSGVFVEVMNSWTKDKYFLIINKHNAAQFATAAISSNNISLSGGYHSPDYNFVDGVRKMMHKLHKAVEKVAIKFAAVGVRSLSLDGEDYGAEAAQAFELVAKQTGVSTQVVSKFAAIGNRALEL